MRLRITIHTEPFRVGRRCYWWGIVLETRRKGKRRFRVWGLE